MATIDIRGVAHSYELTPRSFSSSSPTLIFLHGWLLSQKYWQPLIDRLSRNYQCLTYDLRGFGDSQPPSTETNSDSNYTLAAYALDLRTLVQKLEIKRAWIVGHSLGGSIALWGAKYCPEEIKGVICLNSGGGIYLKEEFERFRAFGKQLVRRRPNWLCNLPFIDLLFTRAMVARPLARAWGRQRVRDLVRANKRAAIASLIESTTETEVNLLPQIVSQLDRSVYFIAGSKDRIMETKYVRHLASFHKSFGANENNVIEIPDCGHLSMIEKPDLVATAITEILNKHQSLDLID